MTATPLDSLAIGSTLSSVNVDTHGHPVTFGMVCDFGMHDDGKPYVEVLEEVPRREVRLDVSYKSAKEARAINVARLRRLNLDQIDPASIEAPNISRMQGWAVKALAGEVVLPGKAFALAIIAAQLYEAAQSVAVSEREQRRAERQAIDDELERRRVEREGLAS